LVLESYTQWAPKNSTAGERIFDTDAQMTQEVVERVHALLQALSRKWHKKVLAIAVSIVATTKLAFWYILNKLRQLRHPVCLEII
jgi:sensor c-di-GMP phosphodiesterase-like protein